MTGNFISHGSAMTLRIDRRLCSGAAMVALIACQSDSTGPGDHTLPPDLTLELTPFISSGLSSPVFLTQPLDDGRIFVVEQPGRIRLIKNGVLQTTPFLDLTSRVLSGGERGLLSVAFHPQYATNHFFYVYFTTQTNGDIRIERFTASENPDVADATSSKLIITAPHSSQANHNGGLLGAMIRLDVDHGDPYAIPSDNPFVGQAGRRGELWAKGLRNPWRYAFDRTTGLLYIADVGQGEREEVDVSSVSTGGINYGWNIMEGTSCYNATTCDETGLQLPVIEYTHDGGACSITGGYVYRGSAIDGLQGHYLYSDYCAGFLKSFRYANGVAVDQKDWGITTGNVTSFGQDIDGELYVLADNTIYRIVAG